MIEAIRDTEVSGGGEMNDFVFLGLSETRHDVEGLSINTAGLYMHLWSVCHILVVL